MTKKYYKVVRVALVGGEKRLRSCIIRSMSEVEYEPQEFVKAEMGGLFVFGDLELAEYFMGQQYYKHLMEIWECEVVRPRRINFIMQTDWVSTCFDEFYDFWKKRTRMKKKYLCRKKAPKGTVVVDEVKLVRRAS